jgi:hypothetical protein
MRTTMMRLTPTVQMFDPVDVYKSTPTPTTEKTLHTAASKKVETRDDHHLHAPHPKDVIDRSRRLP